MESVICSFLSGNMFVCFKVVLQFTNEQCLQKGNSRRMTLTVSLSEMLCQIPLLGAGVWAVGNHRLCFVVSFVVL